MGEYAKLIGSGEEVKIGTCEDMLYLRADQRHRVWPQSGSVDPARDAAELRFRFPWPDEDNIGPGGFDDPFRKLRVDIAPPEGFEHGIVQFVASAAGYNVSLPCPEGPSEHGLHVHRNGFAGASFLCQQRLIDGVLMAVFECACGRKWRAPTLVDAEPACTELLARAERQETLYDGKPNPVRPLGAATIELTTHGKFLVEVARRIREGYNLEA